MQRGEPLTSQTGGSLLPAPAAAFRVGQREAGLSQKDGLPIPLLEEHLAVQGHRPALEGQPRGCPFVVGRGGGLAVGCATGPTHTRRTPA